MSNGMGVAGSATKGGAMFREQGANGCHPSGISGNLRPNVDLLKYLVDGKLTGRNRGGLPTLELGEYAELGYANGKVVRVEDCERNGPIVSNPSNGSTDENVEITRTHAVADAVK